MMKDKKNIDRLFTERFKDFEATPSPEVWDRIKEKLKEEEDDRKLIPIWWKWAGVAALLVLLITAGKFVFFQGMVLKTNLELLSLLREPVISGAPTSSFSVWGKTLPK